MKLGLNYKEILLTWPKLKYNISYLAQTTMQHFLPGPNYNETFLIWPKLQCTIFYLAQTTMQHFLTGPDYNETLLTWTKLKRNTLLFCSRLILTWTKVLVVQHWLTELLCCLSWMIVFSHQYDDHWHIQKIYERPPKCDHLHFSVEQFLMSYYLATQQPKNTENKISKHYFTVAVNELLFSNATTHE